MCTIAFAFFTPTSFDVTEEPNINNKIDRQYNSLSTFMQKSDNIFEIEPTPTADPSDDSVEVDEKAERLKRHPSNLAIEWIAKNQEPEGYWNTAKHGGRGTFEENLLATIFSLIFFSDKYQTDRHGKYKQNVKTALAWVVQQQKKDGSWVDDNFLNALCSLILIDAYRLESSVEKPEALKEKSILAIKHLLKQQNSQGFFDQTPYSMQSDMFVTSWCIATLKWAMVDGILKDEIEKAFAKCAKFLDETDGTNDNEPDSKGLAWSVPGISQGDGTLHQMAAVMIRKNMGWKSTEPWFQAAMNGQAKNCPAQYKDINPYHTILCMYTIFYIGHWRDLEYSQQRIIGDAQRLDGDFKGSWDPNNIAGPAPTDRITYTAILGSAITKHDRYGNLISYSPEPK